MRISDWSSDVCSSDLRNAALPERIADHAMAILRDGEMGEPEVSLSPLTYHWQHQVAIELFVADPDASTRDARMDGLLTELATLIEADRTLAAVVEYAEKIGRASWRERVCQYV